MKLLNGKDTFTIKWRKKGTKDWHDYKFPAAKTPMRWVTESKMQAYCERLRKANPDYEFRETMWLAAFAI